MKNALINPDQPCMNYDEPPAQLGVYVVEVEENVFPVSDPLFWTECPDNVIAYQYYWKDGSYFEIPIPPPPPPPVPPSEVSGENGPSVV